MYTASPRQLPVTDQISIYWWRLVIYVTRRVNRFKIRAQPIYSPIRPFLWLPLLALLFGMVLGWVIALA